LNLKN